MSHDTLNAVSDWVGIPLLVLLIASLALFDIGKLSGRPLGRRQLIFIAILALASLALNIVRFSTLA